MKKTTSKVIEFEFDWARSHEKHFLQRCKNHKSPKWKSTVATSTLEGENKTFPKIVIDHIFSSLGAAKELRVFLARL